MDIPYTPKTVYQDEYDNREFISLAAKSGLERGKLWYYNLLFRKVINYIELCDLCKVFFVIWHKDT